MKSSVKFLVESRLPTKFGGFRILAFDSGVEEFYNLITDEYENTNLIGTTLSSEAANAKAVLEAEALRIRS